MDKKTGAVMDKKEAITPSEFDQMIEEIAGAPDYAVILNIWTWPDGGWMAGCIVVDVGWGKAQGLVAIKALYETEDESWDMYDGFAHGRNAHGSTKEEAVRDLLLSLKGEL